MLLLNQGSLFDKSISRRCGCLGHGVYSSKEAVRAWKCFSVRIAFVDLSELFVL